MFKQIRFVAALPLALVIAFQAMSASAAADDSYAPYTQHEDAVAMAQATFAEAAQNEKLALVIIGANWCHDSKALAKRLEDPTLNAIIGDSYETLIAGVGYFEQGFDLAKRLGVEIYTHTPTVLIYDPQTERVVNLDDHHIWRDAARLSDEETLTYFMEKADPVHWTPASSKGGASRLTSFEAQQAQRLRAAYAILGPKLKARSEDLDAYWGPVRDFRYQFADDLKRLREEERRAADNGTDFKPDWPSYEAFPWETDGSGE